MKRRLHEHLRSGLPFREREPIEDLLEPLQNDYENADELAAKRQRVQKIAEDYLRLGQAPTLLSTRLKGPFNGGWQNPWAKPVTEQEVLIGRIIPDSLDADIVVRSECKKWRDTASVKVVIRSSPRKDNITIQSDARSTRSSTRIIRTKRGDGLQVGEQSILDRCGQEIPEEEAVGEDIFLPIEPSSPQTGAQTRQSITHTEWLKRRKEDIVAERYMESPIHDLTFGSPTHSRGNTETELNLPRPASRSPPEYPKTPVLDTQLQSSASAPMAIASPYLPTVGLEQQSGTETVTAQDFGRQPPSIHQTGSTPFLDTQNPGSHLESSVLRLYERTPLGLESAKKSGNLSRNQISYREEIQHSAARCADLSNASSKRKKSRKSMDKPEVGFNESPGIVPLPQLAPTSFSGSFTYRKVGNRKARKEAKKPTPPGPQPVNFDSPPSIAQIAKGDLGTTDPKDNEEAVPVEVQVLSPSKKNKNMETRGTQTHTPRPDIYDDISGEGARVEVARSDNRRESGSSRQSLYSTQAAMMLAHLEFQDGTFPSSYASSGSQTPRAPLQLPDEPLHGTPEPIMKEPSPVITPFHAFHAELDKKHPDIARTTTMAPISTQDLFAAASPFAFSTVKKVKSTAPIRGSSLRFAVLSPTEAQDKHTDNETARSPTPSADRIPLKQRNSVLPFRSTLEKSSQKTTFSSQESTMSTTMSPQFGQRTPGTELPHLSLATSLDGGVNFADQFLRNLNGLAT